VAIRYFIVAVLALTVVAASTVVAAPATDTVQSDVVKASVTKVLEGGVLRVRAEGKDQSVRLYGVWVPQDPRATVFVEERAGGREVLVRTMPRVCWEDHNRPEVILYASGLSNVGLSLNVAVIINGFGAARAPRCPSYSPIEVGAWLPLEAQARMSDRGLWPDGGVAFATFLQSGQ